MAHKTPSQPPQNRHKSGGAAEHPTTIKLATKPVRQAQAPCLLNRKRTK